MIDPVTLAEGTGAAIVVVLVGTKLLGLIKPKSSAPKTRARSDDKRTSKAIEDGDYGAAAARVAEAGDLESAYELYLLAQQPLMAAQIALGLGKPALAGELYEKAGDKARAVVAYRLAEMNGKVKELEAEMAAAAGGSEAKAPAKLAGPGDRAEEAVGRWRKAVRDAGEKPDESMRERLEGVAQIAAEAWISAGDMRRAAEFCREAGLVDYAMNLYVNALGDPGAAAELMAERGDHKRAAELYELAGKTDKSTEAWIDWSKGADDPLACLDDVKRLGEEAAATFLQAVMAARPIVQNNIDLHYRIAMAMENRPEHAKAVVDRIAAIDPGYRDINERLEKLALQIAQLTAASPAGIAGPGEEAPPPEVSRPEDGEASAVPPRAPLGAYVVRPAARGGMGPRLPPSAGLAGDTEDPLVEEAQHGPSIASLRGVIGGRAPDLGNIEVYYRLGMALLARGKLAEAERAFAQVEEVSPGYRDAGARASQVETWKASAVPSLTPDPESGQVAKRYKLLGQIGRGATTVVFHARDESIGRDVALKFVTDETAANREFMDSFAREARAAWTLSHRNVAKIYDVSQLDGRPFICMELVDGTSVDALLEKTTRLPVPEALLIAEQVLAALEHAHAKNIIHRGIKPSNILRVRGGTVKVVDFGIADPIDVSQAQESTAITGNPAYMAPEQLAGRSVDPRADLFSVGATLFEMLTGELPFAGTDRVSAPKSLRELLPAATPSLESLVTRSMELESDRRFSSAKEMLAVVKALRQEA